MSQSVFFPAGFLFTFECYFLIKKRNQRKKYREMFSYQFVAHMLKIRQTESEQQ